MTSSTDSQSMTYEQVLAAARAIFPNCTVEGEDDQWVIKTEVDVVEDMTPFVGTPAYEANEEYEPNYGSTLGRWASKNGFGYTSLHEAAIAYNEMYWEHEQVALRRNALLVSNGHQDIVDALARQDWDFITPEHSRTYLAIERQVQAEVRQELRDRK